MYDGSRSPVTQTFGLGMFAEPTADDLDRLEAFFIDRGAPVFHEVSPLADKSLWPMIAERRYQLVEFTSVMFLPLHQRVAAASYETAVRVRVAGSQDHEVWAQTAAAGWRDVVDFDDLMIDLLRVTKARPDEISFLAELNAQPIAAGTLFIHDGVALFAGASTIPAARNQGAQRALLESRFQYAAEAGCDLAMMCAEPGSASQRNAERQGFRIAYTRIKWKLPEAQRQP
jgi:GNAT superfamily N-acetyltransferase